MSSPSDGKSETDDEAAEQIASRFLDVRRTDLHRRFFHTFQYPLASGLLHDVEQLDLPYDSFAGSREARSSGYSGWLYWLLYLKGYTQYRSDHVVNDDNVYYRYLTLRYAAQDADPNLRTLSTSSAAVQRIMLRFSDCDRLSEPATAAKFAEQQLAPVTVFVRNPPAEEDVIRVHEAGSRLPIQARLVDGHHRLFGARLFGVKRMRFDILQEQKFIPLLSGHIGYMSLEGSHLKIRGWAISPSLDVHCVEVRSGDRTICRAPLTVEAASVGDPGVNETEHKVSFSVDCEVTVADRDIKPTDIMVLANWLPVGKLTIAHES